MSSINPVNSNEPTVSQQANLRAILEAKSKIIPSEAFFQLVPKEQYLRETPMSQEEAQDHARAMMTFLDAYPAWQHGVIGPMSILAGRNLAPVDLSVKGEQREDLIGSVGSTWGQQGALEFMRAQENDSSALRSRRNLIAILEAANSIDPDNAFRCLVPSVQKLEQDAPYSPDQAEDLARSMLVFLDAYPAWVQVSRGQFEYLATSNPTPREILDTSKAARERLLESVRSKWEDNLSLDLSGPVAS